MPFAAPVMPQVARMLFPSTSARTMVARSAVLSLFISLLMVCLGGHAYQEARGIVAATGALGGFGTVTIGVAALSENADAIVIMTDKRVTIGDYELTIDQTFAKILPTAAGWFAAYAGNATFAESVIAWAHTKWNQLGQDERPTFQIGLLGHFHDAYLAKYAEAAERNVLKRRLYDAELWRLRSTTSDFDTKLRDEILTEAREWDEEHGAELLVFGFDPRGEGHVLSLDLDTEIHEQEWAAIGAGRTIAEGRLAWRKTRRDRGLARTLYEVYEAAVHASLNPTVGVNLIGAVMVGNGQNGIVPVPPDVMGVLEAVFRRADGTPFRTTNLVPEDARPLPGLSDGWEAQLRSWVGDVMSLRTQGRTVYVTEPPKPSSSPSEPVPPSSQSRSDEPRSTSRPALSRPSSRRAAQARRQPDSSPVAPSPRGRSKRQVR